VGILDGDFERIARFSTIPIVSFLSQDGKKDDDFCADDEKSII